MAFLLPLGTSLFRGVITNVVKGAAENGAKSVATDAASSAQNARSDKEFREKWTPGQLGIVGPQHPGKNIVIVCTKHDATKLQGVEHSVLKCLCPASNSTVNYDCYAFDSGDFELQGDGGYENWAMSGKFVKDGKKACQTTYLPFPCVQSKVESKQTIAVY